MKIKIFISLLLILFTSCDRDRLNFDKAIIPTTPENFQAVNSNYDDYNSAGPRDFTMKYFPLLFSTNRYSNGSNFDYILYDCEIYANLVTGEFEINGSLDSCSLIASVNSACNELGPYSTYDFDSVWYENSWDGIKRFFYTTDVNGNNDIFFCYFTVNNHDFMPSGDTSELTGINSVYDDGYFTLNSDETANRETAYFSSDRGGNFDIYRAVSEEDKLIDQSPGMTIAKAEQLSSDADDTCPYIIDNIMVFVSNRDGGFGGFDLWYSVYDGQQWSEPVNFGESINTAYDEFRPIIIRTDTENFFNDLMIFSSNRPGGAGRFDLYYAGMNSLD